MLIENLKEIEKDYTLESSTGVRNNENALKGFLNKHSVACNYVGILTIVSGMLTFKWNDNNESLVLEAGNIFKIEESREHQLILNWNVEFKVDFYKKK